MTELREIIDTLRAAGMSKEAKKLSALCDVITLEVVRAWHKEIYK